MSETASRPVSRQLADEITAVFSGVADHYRQEVDALLERLPWWARPYAYVVVWDALKPDFGKIVDRWRRYADHAEAWKGVTEVLDRADPDVVRYRPKRHEERPWMIVVSLRVREGIEDVHPILADLLTLGWEVDRITDDSTGRDWKLERDDMTVQLLVCAYAGSAARCEIVERKVVKEETEYELICEGERELVGHEVAS